MISSPVIFLILILAALAVISYLLGSVNFAVIFTKKFKGVDVRDFGSKNAGMTNVSRVAGGKAAILTLLCDAAKGAAAVAAARYLGAALLISQTGDYFDKPFVTMFFCCFAGLCCAVGHIYPLFFGFKGGKGIATLLGVTMVADWRISLIALAVFLILFLLTKIVSISSMTAAVTLPITAAIFYHGTNLFVLMLVFMLIYMAIVLITHRKNIVRLIHGEENKIGKK